MKCKILVVDIGGSHVKLLRSANDKWKFESGAKMQPDDFVKGFRETASKIDFNAISVGFPSVIHNGEIVKEPKHLGKGWIGFHFQKALGKPTRVINDAAMQALGSYTRGRMLFLGLGTGLGSALVWDPYLLPLELGDLPYRDHHKIEDFLGIEGLEQLGKKDWRKEVLYAIAQLKLSFIVDTIVLGGGNVHKINRLPKDVKRGDNRNAFRGGVRLWERKRESTALRWKIL